MCVFKVSALNFYIEAKTCANTPASTDGAKEKMDVKVDTPQKTQSVKVTPAVVLEAKKEDAAGSKPTTQTAVPPVEKNGVIETTEVADFDMPLIVHVDDSLNELDSDIVKGSNTKKQGQSNIKESTTTGEDPGQGGAQKGATSTSGAAVGASGDSTSTAASVEVKSKDGKTDKEDAKKAEVGKGDGAKLSQQETKRLVCMNSRVVSLLPPEIEWACYVYSHLVLQCLSISCFKQWSVRFLAPNITALILLEMSIRFCLLPFSS